MEKKGNFPFAATDQITVYNVTGNLLKLGNHIFRIEVLPLNKLLKSLLSHSLSICNIG